MKLEVLVVLLLSCLQQTSARKYYFDSDAAKNGKGTHSSPFNQLDALRDIILEPGDYVLLKRGSSFSQALELHDSGSPRNAIIVQAYGHDSQPEPHIQAKPKELSSVLLNGTSHIVVQDLDITNTGDNTTARRGLHVYAEDTGIVRDITLRRLHIHNVEGYMPSTSNNSYPVGKYANASGGIVLEAAGNNTATSFENVLIEDNIIESVGRQGIYTWSNWCQRSALAHFWFTLCSREWAPSTGLVIRQNRLSRIGGDGIVITGNVAAEVSYNHLDGFHVNAGGNNAGVWTANSDLSHFHHNVVSGGKTTNDGMSFDVDHSTSGTVFEYNVSHDNEGGFFLLCPYDKPTTNFTIRYNLSVNDRARVIQICPGDLVDGRIYKNTIFIGDGISSFLVLSPKGHSYDVLFADNIVAKSGSGNVTWQLDDPKFNVTSNVLHGIHEYAAANGTIAKSALITAAGLRDPQAYKLLKGSPAYGSAVHIDGDATMDFFSYPVTGSENIGFYNGPVVEAPQLVSTFDDSQLTNWQTQGSVSVVQDPSGNLGRSLKIEPGSIANTHYKATETGIRIDMRVMVVTRPSAQGDKNRPSILSVGSWEVSTKEIPTVHDGLWHILEVILPRRGEKAAAYLDGRKLRIRRGKAREGTIQLAANADTLYIDDVLIKPP